jgi:cytoskeletal protein RodZ
MRDRYQGGSLAGFIIIGVLLALVLVGGLYGLNRYNAQKTNEQVAANDQSETKTEDKAKEQPTTKVDDKEAEERSQSQTKVTAPRASQESTDSQPKPEPKPAATPTPTQTSTSSRTNTHLPQTGPADTLVSLLVVGALTFAATYYMRSREA